jgi:hypothetical protein
MTSSRALRVCCAAVWLWFYAVPLTAQVTTGTVSGTVEDPQGGRIPGATVTLISESRGTRSTPVTTGSAGDYVVPNATPDRYTIEVVMDGFKTLLRRGVDVSSGDRVSIPPLVIELGAQAETVNVIAEAALVQAQSAERSFTIATTEVENLPLSNRNFASLAALAPGVVGTQRIGGGGQSNFTMDGVSIVDTGNNGQMLQMNVDAIGEVKILTSNYQAEYGRSSGLQITAVTKSGTNRFRGSVYDVIRNSDWNSNTWANIQNGLPKPVSKQSDWGYTLGGPVGKPGGTNNLFFFYSHEYRPREGGGTVSRFRLPTLAERRGDFSQTRDNTGSVFNLIRDAATGLPCTATDTRGCFQDGGVVGRIPQDRLYAPGLAILNNLWPVPNVEQGPGMNYNYEVVTPVSKSLTYQPSVRVDYQPTTPLRFTGRFSGQNSAAGRPLTPGSLPNYNDTQRIQGTEWITTWAFTTNYSLGPTTFLEGTYGRSRNYGTTVLMTDVSNVNNVGLGSLPLLYPDGRVVDEGFFAFEALSKSSSPYFDNGRIWLPPNFAWGTRIGCANTNNGGVALPCPPNLQFPGALNTNITQDVSINLTKVTGRHTLKGGFYWNNSLKAQNINLALGALPFNGLMNFSNDANNPLDSGFGYSNAALGILSVYQQQSRFVEGNYVYNNREFYLQDNWKVNPRLTLDYGMRFVNQQPQHDRYRHSANFLPDRWNLANAPVLYVPGCAAGVFPCTGTNRQAMNPRTGQLLGGGSAVFIGQIVPNSGDTTQGLFQAGQGISEYAHEWPTLGLAPRFGAAYDVTGRQQFVLRGGAGMFYDRPPGDAVQNLVSNPPYSTGVTLRAVRLQDIAASQGNASAPVAPTQLFSYRYDDGLPSSAQWNAGIQMTLPWSSTLDLSYVGQHAWNQLNATGAGANGQNLNTVDIGAAFLPENQDRTLAPTGTPGANAVVADLMRAFRGYGNVLQQMGDFWRTYHSIQTTYQRRFRNGVSAEVAWTWSLSDNGTTGLQPRFQHAPDGTISLRDDWDQFVEMNKDQGLVKHRVKANFVWDLPDLNSGSNALSKVAAGVLNNWQLSGIVSVDSGTPYSVDFSYQSGGGSVNLTGSPDYPAKIRLVGDPGGGCSSNQHRQFNTDAFSGPVSPSLGLESGRNYLVGCGDRTVDLAIARNFKLGGNRQAQIRLEAFNAFDTVIYSSRVTGVQYNSPTDQTVRNPQYNADGTLVSTRLTPANAGFGAVNGAQALRSLQLQLRFAF